MSEVIHPVERFKVSKLTKHPNNPRILRDGAYQTLKKSIEDNPDLLEARPLILSNRTGKNIVIGGNQRLQVVKDLGWLTVPCVMFPDLTEEKEREIMIRDNVSNGEWDFDKLKEDWDTAQLNEWGLAIREFEPSPDYSILDENEIDDKLDELSNNVKKAIQIEFNNEDYDEAYDLINFWRKNTDYIGGMIIEFLKSEKEKI